MMGAGLGVGVNVDGAGPQLLRPDTGEGDGRLAVHARCLGGVRVELVAGHHAYPIVLPGGGRVTVVVVEVMGHGVTRIRVGKRGIVRQSPQYGITYQGSGQWVTTG